MSDVEFKPIEPFDLYEIYREELNVDNPQSLKFELGFPPSKLRHFLNDKNGAMSKHRADLSGFNERVDKVGAFLMNIKHYRADKELGIPPSRLNEQEVGAYQEFHNRLGRYALVLESGDSVDTRELAFVSGNVACSVNPEAWRGYGEHFNIPQYGVDNFTGMARYLQTLINNSFY